MNDKGASYVPSYVCQDMLLNLTLSRSKSFKMVRCMSVFVKMHDSQFGARVLLCRDITRISSGFALLYCAFPERYITPIMVMGVNIIVFVN